MSLLTAGLWLASLLGTAGVQATELNGGVPGVGPAPPVQPVPAPKPPEDGSCGKHGTTVEFVDSPSEAARLAQKEQKLVFVLHLSGLFEDPRLT
jgi:hypothetical protein